MESAVSGTLPLNGSMGGTCRGGHVETDMKKYQIARAGRDEADQSADGRNKIVEMTGRIDVG